MEKITRKDLDRIVSDMDVTYDTWAPGDGYTRYRFHARTDKGHDYFSCTALFTALGLKEAYTWAQGYRAAFHGYAKREVA